MSIIIKMEKFEPRNIKGAADFLPAVQIMRNRVIDTLRGNFERFGFLPLETALLNYYDLLSYKYDDNAEILREIYKIKDQGERDLGLRFDLTVPFCKVIAMNRNLRMPFKRYEIGKVFRNGPVKLGRTREFYQCDVDCVGLSGAHIEAEFILLAVKSFIALGIEPVIKIGNRKSLVAMIEEAGVKGDVEAVVGILDRIEKVDRAETVAELKKYNAQKVLDIKPVMNDETKELIDILDQMGISKYCSFAPYLARGLNIYTGTVWEIYDKAGRIGGALGAGGRYDNIIGNFIDNGQKYPAVGMSFGLEPICAVLGMTAEQGGTHSTDLMLIPMGTEIMAQLFAEKLRAAGIRVLVNLSGKSVGKAFEYANAEKIPFVCVIGCNEIEKNEVNIKNMATGEQRAFGMSDAKKIQEYVR